MKATIPNIINISFEKKELYMLSVEISIMKYLSGYNSRTENLKFKMKKGNKRIQQRTGITSTFCLWCITISALSIIIFTSSLNSSEPK